MRLPGDLTNVEQELVAKTCAGEEAALAGGTVRASVVAALCTAGAGDVDRRGVRLDGAIVTGTLDLSAAKLPVPLWLRHCRLDERVVLADATAPSITLIDCELVGGLDAVRLRTEGMLDLSGTTALDTLTVFDARIGADFDCRYCDLRGSDYAIAAPGIHIGADLVLAGTKVTSGRVDLQQATIGRSAIMQGLTIDFEPGPALSLSGAEVRGDIALAPGPTRDETGILRTQLRGGLDLAGATMSGLNLTGACLRNADEVALNLWGATVKRDIDLFAWLAAGEDEPAFWRCEIHGLALLTAASVGGDITALGARLTGAPTSVNGDDLRVEGTVYLSYVEMHGELVPTVAEGAISLVSAEMHTLVARGSQLGSLSMWGAAVERDVNLSAALLRDGGTTASLPTTLTGELELSAARIGRDLRLDGAHLQAEGYALLGDRLEVGGSAYLVSWIPNGHEPLRFMTKGTVLLHAARLGALRCDGAHIEDPQGLALRLSRATVAGDVSLRRQQADGDDDERSLRCELDGWIDASDAVINGHLALDGARLRAADTALTLRGATVAGDVSLRPAMISRDEGQQWTRCEVEGEIDAHNALLHGNVMLDGASLTAKEVALSLEQAEVARDVTAGIWFDSPERILRSEVRGDLHLSGATINGSLRCSGAIVQGRLAAGGIRIDGNVELDRGRWRNQIVEHGGKPVRFEAHGPVSFQNAAIGGVLTCRGAWVSAPDDIAFNLYGIHVGSDVLFERATEERMDAPGPSPPVPFECDGTVRLFSAKVGKNLSFKGAEITARGTAIVAANVEVEGHLSMWNATVHGRVDISRTSADTLDCEQARFSAGDTSDKGAIAFDASYFRTSGEVVWAPAACDGSVSFHGAVAGALADDPATWPSDGAAGAWMDLDGFVYDRLTRKREWKVRREWLRGLRGLSPQPYRQLAAVYARSGDDSSARKINMERFNTRLRRGFHPWRWILRLGIGHGYEPWRALVPLIAVWLIAVWVASLAADAGAMKPTRPGISTTIPATDCERTDYPCLQPWLYAADLVVPVVNLGQRERWTPTGPKRYELLPPLATMAGWILTTLVVAGFTGLVRRE